MIHSKKAHENSPDDKRKRYYVEQIYLTTDSIWANCLFLGNNFKYTFRHDIYVHYKFLFISENINPPLQISKHSGDVSFT